jgi:hypothetical protein
VVLRDLKEKLTGGRLDAVVGLSCDAGWFHDTGPEVKGISVCSVGDENLSVQLGAILATLGARHVPRADSCGAD